MIRTRIQAEVEVAISGTQYRFVILMTYIEKDIEKYILANVNNNRANRVDFDMVFYAGHHSNINRFGRHRRITGKHLKHLGKLWTQTKQGKMCEHEYEH